MIQDNGAERDFELPTRLLISTNRKPEPSASDSDGVACLSFRPIGSRNPQPLIPWSGQAFAPTNSESEPAATDSDHSSDGAVRLSFRPIGSTNAASDSGQFSNLFISLLCRPGVYSRNHKYQSVSST